MGKLHFIASYLLEHEDMDGDLFKAVMENTELDDEALSAHLKTMVEEKLKESQKANEERARADAERKAKEKAKNDTLQADVSEAFDAIDTPAEDNDEDQES